MTVQAAVMTRVVAAVVVVMTGAVVVVVACVMTFRWVFEICLASSNGRKEGTFITCPALI